MDWIYGVRSKLKVAAILLVLIGAVLLGTFLERHYVKNINSSSSSMYNDRLIPATEIYYLSDNIFSKYLLMERVLMHPDKADLQVISGQFAAFNKEIDSLIRDYEMTYLVDSESESLQIFKDKLRAYNRLEEEVLHAAINKDEPGVDPRKIHLLFTDLRKEMRELSRIQTTVGKELISGTKNMLSRASLISNLQIAILIILCMLAQSLILGHRDTQHRNDRFRWN